MTIKSFFIASDGSLFIPIEQGVNHPVRRFISASDASKACEEYEKQLKNEHSDGR